MKGLARFSWQKGSLPTVQISVSYVRFRVSDSVFPVSDWGWYVGRELTGLRVFLISASREPPLRAMIPGAASGSWAIGEPHSLQKMRWTALPELPLPAHDLVGPLMVSLSLGTTTTSAVHEKATVGQTYPVDLMVSKGTSLGWLSDAWLPHAVYVVGFIAHTSFLAGLSPLGTEGARRRELLVDSQAKLTVGRAALALAVVAMIVSGHQGRIHVCLIRDGLAKTVAGENHFGQADDPEAESLMFTYVERFFMRTRMDNLAA